MGQMMCISSIPSTTDEMYCCSNCRFLSSSSIMDISGTQRKKKTSLVWPQNQQVPYLHSAAALLQAITSAVKKIYSTIHIFSDYFHPFPSPALWDIVISFAKGQFLSWSSTNLRLQYNKWQNASRRVCSHNHKELLLSKAAEPAELIWLMAREYFHRSWHRALEHGCSLSRIFFSKFRMKLSNISRLPRPVSFPCRVVWLRQQQ